MAECSSAMGSVDGVVMSEGMGVDTGASAGAGTAVADAMLTSSVTDCRCGRGAAIGDASLVSVDDAPNNAPNAKRGTGTL